MTSAFDIPCHPNCSLCNPGKFPMRNEKIALENNKENSGLLHKLRDRLTYKVQRLEILKIEVKQLRELIIELEKETRK